MNRSILRLNMKEYKSGPLFRDNIVEYLDDRLQEWNNKLTELKEQNAGPAPIDRAALCVEIYKDFLTHIDQEDFEPQEPQIIKEWETPGI
jgi:hypothetical protein